MEKVSSLPLVSMVSLETEGPVEPSGKKPSGPGMRVRSAPDEFQQLPIDIDEIGSQSLLREISSESLLLALKGCDENLKEKFFQNMSKRAAEMLRDDLEAKGPVRVSEVETAQKEIVGVARRMSEEGQLVLGGRGGDEFI